MRFAGYVPEERLPELLATGDVHAVPLRRGLAAVSVPSKTYSILAAGRPVVAAIDPGTEIPAPARRVGRRARRRRPTTRGVHGRGRAGSSTTRRRRRRWAGAGRAWVVAAASPAAVAASYEALIRSLAHAGS